MFYRWRLATGCIFQIWVLTRQYAPPHSTDSRGPVFITSSLNLNSMLSANTTSLSSSAPAHLTSPSVTSTTRKKGLRVDALFKTVWTNLYSDTRFDLYSMSTKKNTSLLLGRINTLGLLLLQYLIAEDWRTYVLWTVFSPHYLLPYQTISLLWIYLFHITISQWIYCCSLSNVCHKLQLILELYFKPLVFCLRAKQGYKQNSPVFENSPKGEEWLFVKTVGFGFTQVTWTCLSFLKLSLWSLSAPRDCQAITRSVKTGGWRS